MGAEGQCYRKLTGGHGTEVARVARERTHYICPLGNVQYFARPHEAMLRANHLDATPCSLLIHHASRRGQNPKQRNSVTQLIEAFASVLGSSYSWP